MNYTKEEQDAIKLLVSKGWVFGYLSGHGDAEYVFDNIGEKWLVVGDAEKRMIVLEPKGKYSEPWDFYK